MDLLIDLVLPHLELPNLVLVLLEHLLFLLEFSLVAVDRLLQKGDTVIRSLNLLEERLLVGLILRLLNKQVIVHLDELVDLGLYGFDLRFILSVSENGTPE